MTEINQRLLGLILQGKTNKEIMQTLKITPKQLQIRLDALKYDGYNAAYNISDDGSVRYEILKSIAKPLTNTTKLKLVKNPSEFTALIISDLHIGHHLECLERLNYVYDFADKKEINIIINCGDVIEGCCNSGNEDTIKKQLEKLITSYPYSPNILNLTCFGNHDYSPLEQFGIDISKIITTQRTDFISLGFGLGIINIRNGQLLISHPTKQAKYHPNYYFRKNEQPKSQTIIKGHGHHTIVKDKEGICIIKAPTISNVIHTQNRTNPGILKLTIHLNQTGEFESHRLECFEITDKKISFPNAIFEYKYPNKQTIIEEDKVLTRKPKKFL